MQTHEILARAAQYLTQALDKLETITAAPDLRKVNPGEWVSLRANIESARADLDVVLAQPTDQP